MSGAATAGLGRRGSVAIGIGAPVDEYLEALRRLLREKLERPPIDDQRVLRRVADSLQSHLVPTRRRFARQASPARSSISTSTSVVAQPQSLLRRHALPPTGGPDPLACSPRIAARRCCVFQALPSFAEIAARAACRVAAPARRPPAAQPASPRRPRRASISNSRSRNVV